MSDEVFETVVNAIEKANLEREADNSNWQEVFFDRTKNLPYPERVDVFRDLKELKEG